MAIVDPRLTAIGLGLQQEVARLQEQAGLNGEDVMRALATATYAFGRGLGLEPREIHSFLADWVTQMARSETPAFREALRSPREQAPA